MLIILLVVIFFSDGREPEAHTVTMPSGPTCVSAGNELEARLRNTGRVKDVYWNCLGIAPATDSEPNT